MNKDEIIRGMIEGYQRWNDLLDEVPPERMTLRGVAGDWSIKDIISHIGWYEWWTAEFIRTRAWPDLPAHLDSPDTDARNHAFFLENRDVPLAAVRSWTDESHHALVESLKHLSDEDFADQTRLGMPAEEGWDLPSLIPENSFLHYAEHAEQVRAWVATRGSRVRGPGNSRSREDGRAGSATQLMPAGRILKVYAYVTSGHRLLVFDHAYAPEAGTQVPGGTVEAGESPESAVLREAQEETGLTTLNRVKNLGEADYEFSVEGRSHSVRRSFFHLICPGNPPNTWRHYERNASGAASSEIPFDFRWVDLSEEIPLLAAELDCYLAQLIDNMVR